jgi:multidrug efflux pump subunit AcrA (membrane-fusion protein)
MTRSALYLIPAVIGFAGCGEQRGSVSASVPQELRITVVRALPQQWPTTYEATGTVRARTSAVVSAKWMGYVREVQVNVGDHVREGQLLVALDARDLDTSTSRAAAAREEVRSGMPEAESAVASAKANLDLAQATFHRMTELYEKKSISDQEFDESSARLKAAQSALDMARARRSQLDSKLEQTEQEVRAARVTRSYASIEAPFAGVVTARSIDPGGLAVPGAPLLTIERESYRSEASVEESKMSTIHIGQTASVKVDGTNGAFTSRVSEIVPVVDAASRSYIVKIDLPGVTALRSGMFGRAIFPLGSHEVLAIPAAAVSERGQLQSVFVVDNGVARTRLITLGVRVGDQVEVLSGLTAGEQLVAPVPQGLSDGSSVEVRP